MFGEAEGKIIYGYDCIGNFSVDCPADIVFSIWGKNVFLAMMPIFVPIVLAQITGDPSWTMAIFPLLWLAMKISK